MRVAIVSESFLPTINGVTTSVRKVLDHLKAEGHEAMVICPSAGSPAEYNGFPVHAVPSIAYRQFPMGLPSPSVQALLRDFEPDVLHAASPFLLGGQAIGAASRLGVPSVAIFQTDVAGYARRNHLGAATGLAWRLVRKVHDLADLTLAPSSASAADLAAAGVERIERWGRGVDLEAYHPRTRTDPDALAVRRSIAPGGEVVVGFVGRVAPEKRLETLEALRGIHGIRIVIVGDGPSVPAVTKALKGMPVSWLGPLSGRDLALAYAAFDIFVTPGTEETFGQTIQEAHAAGLPVVAPRVGGPIDLVDDGTDGYLYAPDDRARLRLAVYRLASDADLRARFGEAGRRAVLGRSWQAICGELMQHYERVIANGSSGASEKSVKDPANLTKLSRSQAI
ncbi:MAG: glycosyl transferase [Microbacteriaceae bacterium]|nr:glycosyl transferase [Microbacteriaceae bacterium]